MPLIQRELSREVRMTHGWWHTLLGRASSEVQTFYLPRLPSPTPFGKSPPCLFMLILGTLSQAL